MIEDYSTYQTVHLTPVTSFITFATQYIDTIVTTNVSKVVRTHTHTSIFTTALGDPEIPNSYNQASGPSVTQVGLNGSIATTFGATM